MDFKIFMFEIGKPMKNQFFVELLPHKMWLVILRLDYPLLKTVWGESV
jgi:hypothetical protein